MVLKPTFHYVKLKLFFISCCLLLLPKSHVLVSSSLCSLCSQRDPLECVRCQQGEHPTSGSGLCFLFPLHASPPSSTLEACADQLSFTKNGLKGARAYYRSQFQRFHSSPWFLWHHCLNLRGVRVSSQKRW